MAFSDKIKNFFNGEKNFADETEASIYGDPYGDVPEEEENTRRGFGIGRGRDSGYGETESSGETSGYGGRDNSWRTGGYRTGGTYNPSYTTSGSGSTTSSYSGDTTGSAYTGSSYQSPSYSASSYPGYENNYGAGSSFPKIDVQFPTSVRADIQKLTQSVLSGNIVIFGLKECRNEAEKKNIILFIAGVAFASRGKFLRFQENTYFVIPEKIVIDGTLDEMLAEKGFIFND